MLQNFDKIRRQHIKSILSASLGLSVASFSPTIWSKKKLSLRVLGTHVTLQEALRQQAMQDLGIELYFEPKGSAAVLQKASTQPSSFDLYEQWSDSMQVLWAAKAIQPINIERIKYWDEINGLTKTGRLTPQSKIGAGDAPYKLLYVEKNGRLSQNQSAQISYLPYVHNVDSFGYNTDEIPKGVPYVTESWGWLFDKKYQGRVGIVNTPTIGLFDMALAAQASGLMRFEDIGNMTKGELDQLFDILLRLKFDGHFNGFWNSVPESVEFMANGRVVIESMFSPAVAALNGRNIPVVFAAPKEGYRGWHGVMCLSAATQGIVKDTAYEYMNWWLSVGQALLLQDKDIIFQIHSALSLF